MNYSDKTQDKLFDFLKLSQQPVNGFKIKQPGGSMGDAIASLVDQNKELQDTVIALKKDMQALKERIEALEYDNVQNKYNMLRHDDNAAYYSEINRISKTI